MTEEVEPGREPLLLERVGARILLRGRVRVPEQEDPIHVLNPEERRGLRRLVRGAVLRASLAGVANAVVTGLGELYALRLLGHRPEHATLEQWARYWGVFGVLAVLFAIAEIAYLYWDALRAVRKMSAVAGLELGSGENADVALALARAALELPNSPEATLGVDPRREASRFALGTASLVYKLKISVTNFLFRALVTRALGRMAARGYLAFTAIPINAAWNALVCWSVLREARIRVMGKSAALEMLDAAFLDEPEPSRDLVNTIHQALGSAVVRTSDLHPNHAALIRAFRARFGMPAPDLPIDRPERFLEALPRLSRQERRVALRVLSAAAILDGKVVRAERELLVEAERVAGVGSGLAHVEKLRRAFVAGDPIPWEDLRHTGHGNESG
ncbi:MAG TPA: hypothetical protein VHE30_11945 [Polyangiaceae bacterium]|nr:hypothetical protein [Polyangiaceae bacterium]